MDLELKASSSKYAIGWFFIMLSISMKGQCVQSIKLGIFTSYSIVGFDKIL